MRNRITLCYGCVKKDHSAFLISALRLCKWTWNATTYVAGNIHADKEAQFLCMVPNEALNLRQTYMLQRLNSELCASKYKARESFALHNDEFLLASLTVTQTRSAAKHAHWSLIHIELPECWSILWFSPNSIHPCYSILASEIGSLPGPCKFTTESRSDNLETLFVGCGSRNLG